MIRLDNVKVILDSISPAGVRLTTVELTYWRAIHSEVLTHRDRARNSASSRAIPFYREKDGEIVQNCTYSKIANTPFIPEFIGYEQKGMQSGDEISGEERVKAEQLINEMRLFNLRKCKELYDLGVHKSIINRYVEPWSYITVVMSATSQNNFLRLRDHPKAEKHFAKIARMFRKAIETSQPKKLEVGQWHLPYTDVSDWQYLYSLSPEGITDLLLAGNVMGRFNDPKMEIIKRVSSARCARVSYLTHDGKRDMIDDLRLFRSLIHPKLKDDRDDDVIHACYDEDTDVLTDSGWKNWRDVTGDELFCTLNLQENKIEYQPAKQTLLGKEYFGPMYQLESKYADLLVTPNHKMVACMTTTLLGRRKNGYGLYTVTNLLGKSHSYLKGGQEQRLSEGILQPRELELLGFAIGDGHCPRRGNQLKFHLRKQRKIAYLKTLVPDIRELSHGVFAMPYPFDFSIYDAQRVKQIPQSVIMNENNLYLFRGLMRSDGSIRKSHMSFSSTSPSVADSFCQICTHLGFGFTVRKYKSCYSINVIRDWLKPEFHKTKTCKSQIKKVENWRGKVYCVSVANGTLFVRRNGIGIWSGNSPLEHVARAHESGGYVSGPFRGWHQFRKDFPNESVSG